MFRNLKRIIENNELKQENQKIKEENSANRQDIEELEFKNYKANILAEDTLTELNKIQEILGTGLTEDIKRQKINIIVNNLRKNNIDIIKELAVHKTY